MKLVGSNLLFEYFILMSMTHSGSFQLNRAKFASIMNF
jgi:hypothetical protein